MVSLPLITSLAAKEARGRLGAIRREAEAKISVSREMT